MGELDALRPAEETRVKMFISLISVSVGRRHARHEAAPEYLPHHQELLRVQAQAKAHKLLEEFVMAHGFQVLGALPLLQGGPFP